MLINAVLVKKERNNESLLGIFFKFEITYCLLANETFSVVFSSIGSPKKYLFS